MDLQSWDRDEGIALMLAQSERDGHRLHRDFFSDVSPLFVASIRIGLDILGTTLAAGRWVILIYAALALFATGWLTALIAGRWAGLAAVVLLGLSPGFRSASRVIWADLPSSGFATLAIALVLQYGRRRSRRWLILAGLAMGASLLVKPLSVAMLVPLVMALWVERVHEDRPFRLLQPLTLLAAATALLPLAALAYYGPHLLSDLLMFSWKAQQAMQVDVLKHLEQVGFYLCRDPGLLALVLPGVLVLFRRQSRHGLLLITWITAMLGLLVTRAPYWGHQTVAVLPPLAIAGGLFLGEIACIGRLAWHRKRLNVTWHNALAAGALTVWLACLPSVLLTTQIHGVSTYLSSELASLIEVLKTHTGRLDYVIADDIGIVFMADRPTPPGLAVTSYKRIAAGHLAANDVQKQTLQYDVAAVVMSPDRFRGQLPEYERWLQENFELTLQTTSGYQLFTPVDWYRRVAEPCQVNFADQINLLGYEMTSAETDTGVVLRVTLYWQAIKPTVVPLTVFLHIVDSTGQLLSGKDTQPMEGLYPTDEWRPGQELRDVHLIELPAALAPVDTYTVEIGLYDLMTMQRLPARDANGEKLPDDALRISFSVDTRHGRSQITRR